jgi:hypothetical protein
MWHEWKKSPRVTRLHRVIILQTHYIFYLFLCAGLSWYRSTKARTVIFSHTPCSAITRSLRSCETPRYSKSLIKIRCDEEKKKNLARHPKTTSSQWSLKSQSSPRAFLKISRYTQPVCSSVVLQPIRRNTTYAIARMTVLNTAVLMMWCQRELHVLIDICLECEKPWNLQLISKPKFEPWTYWNWYMGRDSIRDL